MRDHAPLVAMAKAGIKAFSNPFQPHPMPVPMTYVLGVCAPLFTSSVGVEYTQRSCCCFVCLAGVCLIGALACLPACLLLLCLLLRLPACPRSLLESLVRALTLKPEFASTFTCLLECPRLLVMFGVKSDSACQRSRVTFGEYCVGSHCEVWFCLFVHAHAHTHVSLSDSIVRAPNVNYDSFSFSNFFFLFQFPLSCLESTVRALTFKSESGSLPSRACLPAVALPSCPRSLVESIAPSCPRSLLESIVRALTLQSDSASMFTFTCCPRSLVESIVPACPRSR